MKTVLRECALCGRPYDSHVIEMPPYLCAECEFLDDDADETADAKEPGDG